jgi:hypothetical protein
VIFFLFDQCGDIVDAPGNALFMGKGLFKKIPDAAVRSGRSLDFAESLTKLCFLRLRFQNLTF